MAGYADNFNYDANNIPAPKTGVDLAPTGAVIMAVGSAINWIRNPNGKIVQNLGLSSTVVDGAYARPDLWYGLCESTNMILTSTGGPATTDTYPGAIYVTHALGSSQRFGAAQLIPNEDCAWFIRQQLTWSCLVSAEDTDLTVMVALIKWGGATDAPVKDVVGDWFNLNYVKDNPRTCTISNASPAVVGLTSHGYIANQSFTFTTTGALPTGATVNTPYYVKTVQDANNFTFSATAGGAAINTSSAGSGTHTLHDGFFSSDAGIAAILATAELAATKLTLGQLSCSAVVTVGAATNNIIVFAWTKDARASSKGFYMTGCKLYIGPTDVEVLPRMDMEELFLIQRLYRRANSAIYQTLSRNFFSYQQMRATPTVTLDVGTVVNTYTDVVTMSHTADTGVVITLDARM